MKQKFTKSLIVTVLAFVVAFGSVLSASALPINNVNNAYFYNVDGMDASAPISFTVEKQLSVKDIVAKATSSTVFVPEDLFYRNGYLYILDSRGCAVYVLDEQYRLVSTIRLLTGEIPALELSDATQGGAEGEEEGEEGSLLGSTSKNQYALQSPQGIFVTEDGTIYIADTGNQRIVVCDINGRVSKVIQGIKFPIVGENFAFCPTRLVVDSVNDIQVICQGINRGVIQITSEGKFNAFFGTPNVIPSLGDRIWRNFATEKQLEQMITYTPTEYSSITIDDRGFIYTTIAMLDEASVTGLKGGSTATNHAPVRKLSADGTDMLRRNGLSSPMGDIVWPNLPGYAPKIVDIAVDNESGRYVILDQTTGRFSTYDTTGNLLYISGGTGSSVGTFKRANALEINGDLVYVADKENNTITVFKATAYTLAVNAAAEATASGYWTESLKLWQNVLSYNSNMYIANMCMGEAEMQLALDLIEDQTDADGLTSWDHYERAMFYYNRCDEKANYSTAYMAIRTHELEKYFGLIFGAVGVLVVGYFVLKFVRRYKKHKKEKAEKLAAALQRQEAAAKKYHQMKGDEE